MRYDKNKFHIGTYVLKPYARSEKHIRELKECGIDLVFSVEEDKMMLDLFSKYEIGAVIKGVFPKWWGGHGENAGTLSSLHPIEEYETAAKNLNDHPAIVGIDLGDEPSSLDFEHYGKVAKKVENILKDKVLYLNLYPNYGCIAANNKQEVVEQLGTNTYLEYIEQYLKTIDFDYISYDHYLYSTSVRQAYENLMVVAKACQKTNKSMMIVLQVNSDKQEEYISKNQLRFQSYSALCFGARSITWACYTAGWFYHQVLDDKGEKTPQYDKLKAVNEELLSFSDFYIKYKYQDTYFLSFNKEEEDIKNMDVDVFEKLKVGSIEISVLKGRKVLVGYFTSETKEAVMLCAADEPLDERSNINELQFKVSNKKLILHANKKHTLLQEMSGIYTLSLKSNEGAFIEIIEF